MASTARAAAAAALLLAGCSGPAAPHPLTPLPPLSSAPTTAEQTIVPTHVFYADFRNPMFPDQRAALLADGYGAYTTGPGEARLTRTDEPTPPADTACDGGTHLLRFVHMTDIHVVDDESPMRLAIFDSRAETQAAFRPQSAYECNTLNAMVRTINAQPGVDFVLLGGDSIDNAQGNELSWLLKILDGGSTVSCDSGIDDDPVPGPSNDPKDPFIPVGLRMPWYWVTGNHDVEVQGTFSVNAERSAIAVSDMAGSGTRDFSQPGGPVVTGKVPPDPARALMHRKDLISRVEADGNGHGLDAATVATGKAFYSFDVAGTPLRFIVLDTVAETGGADAVLHQTDVDNIVVPMLDAALADHRWVILASHQPAISLGDGSDFGGTYQPDAITEQDWLDLLDSYPNIIADITGHTHHHQIYWINTGSRGFWNITTSAVIDWPQQTRLIDIYANDNGWICLRTTDLDYDTSGDPIAEQGRHLAILDVTSEWNSDGSGTASDHNVDLWIRAPTF